MLSLPGRTVGVARRVAVATVAIVVPVTIVWLGPVGPARATPALPAPAAAECADSADSYCGEFEVSTPGNGAAAPRPTAAPARPRPTETSAPQPAVTSARPQPAVTPQPAPVATPTPRPRCTIADVDCRPRRTAPRAPAGAVGDGRVAPSPTPAIPPELARTATAQLRLDPPTVRVSAPEGSLGVAPGIPVWMWIDAGITSGPGSNAREPVVATAVDGPLTVTASAVVSGVRWDVGAPFPAGGTCGVGVARDLTVDTVLEARPGECVFPGFDRSFAGTTATVTATVTWAITWSTSTGLVGPTETTELIGRATVPVRSIGSRSTDTGGF